MFAGIHGAQRSGKSYFCIRTCIDFLRNTERDIYTNLPVNPDYMAQYVVGGKLRSLDKYYEVFRRLHIFMDFYSLSDAKAFAKKNRDFWRFCRFDRKYKENFFKDYLAEHGHFPSREERREKYLEYYSAGYIWPTKWIFDFWRLTKRERTVFMFDEFYEFFSSLDYRSNGVETRKNLLGFSRQHGHDDHHIYLISHRPDDLDKIIRDGFMFQYFISNAKNKNLFKNKWLRGLRSPIQYFIVEGYSYGDMEPQDVYPIWPDKAIFNCYNSKSKISTLKDVNFGTCKADKFDDSRGHNFLHNFKRYFVTQGWLTFTVFTSVIFGGYYLYRGYRSIIPSKTTVDVKTSQPLPKIAKKGQGIESDLKITGVFNNKVVWSDQFKLQTGDVYHGLKVQSINVKNESIVFSSPNGKLFSIPFAGCRIKEQPARPEPKQRAGH